MAKNMTELDEKTSDWLKTVPDDVLENLTFSFPWQYSDGTTDTDADGFPTRVAGAKEDSEADRELLQTNCFYKFHHNPHVNTAIRGMVGRIVGFGFETTSEVFEIHREIKTTELDPRNRLYYMWPKYLARHFIEGELFLNLSLHPDGFVEVDFIDPSLVNSIIFHPNKAFFPLFYILNLKNEGKRAVPSIFIARYPNLVNKVQDDPNLKGYLGKIVKKPGIYRKIGGFYQFIVCFEKGLVTKRSVSYLQTILEWLNHYENLKKYEIDHKKSSGAYVWAFKFENVQAFKLWLSLSDDEKRKSALGAKLSPGSRLFLPPGMTVEAINPSLNPLREQDTDILHMIASGVNEPLDILSGSSSSPFSSVKASRGPMSDRVSDEVAFFDRWYINDFWGSIFFLKAAIGKFKDSFKMKEAVGWKDDKTPKFKSVEYRPEELIEATYPSSEISEYENRTRAMLGVKHGPLSESLGIPNSEVAKKLGFGGYGKGRLRKATEDERYPELVYEGGVDAESVQETVEGEKPKNPKLIRKEQK